MFNKRIEKILNDDENKFIVLGGRPEVQKTAMAFKIAEGFVKNNNAVAVFSAKSKSSSMKDSLDEEINYSFNDEEDILAEDISKKVKEIKKDTDIKLVVVDYNAKEQEKTARELLFKNLRKTCDELGVKFLVTSPVSDKVIGKENLSLGDLFSKNDIRAKVADKIIFLENEEAFKVMK